MLACSDFAIGSLLIELQIGILQKTIKTDASIFVKIVERLYARISSIVFQGDPQEGGKFAPGTVPRHDDD